MTNRTRPAAILERLCSTLGQEILAYHGLLRLATRQNRFLRRHELTELESLADAWALHQHEVDGLRQRRIAAQECAARAVGLPADATLGDITQDGAMPGPAGTELARLRRSLKRALAALKRQNTLNGRLARFCLDLAAGEADAVRRGLCDADGATYDARGAMAARSGGVVTRQA